MQRIEIHISYSCGNHCLFCSEGSRLKKFKDFKVDYDQLKTILAEKRKQGFEHVTFTGGEPNMFHEFLGLLSFAKNLGYRIYVGSNGGFWTDQEYVNNVMQYLDQVSLSIHGSEENNHNFHTKNKESYAKIILAFKNIDDYVKKHDRPYFMANISLTNYNLAEVANILKFLSRYKISQVLISNISPEGSAYDNYAALAVRYAQLGDYIAQWVRIANEQGMIIRLFGLPLCIIKGYEAYSNDLNYDSRITYALGKNGSKILLKERKTNLQRRRRYVDTCNSCQAKSICAGIFGRYLEIFGDKEIKGII